MGSMGRLIKLTMRAAKWAGGRPEREEKLRAILDRACRELEQLTNR